jgi:hypothetical protein
MGMIIFLLFHRRRLLCVLLYADTGIVQSSSSFGIIYLQVRKKHREKKTLIKGWPSLW